MKKMKLRAVSLDCLDNDTICQIRLWRNQDFVRKEMFNQELIGEEEHISWIEKLKSDPRRDLYVFYLDDIPLGVYQYYVMDDGETIDVGTYLVNEEYKEEGYGAIMMYAFAQLAYQVLHFKRDISKVIASNADVIRMNHRFGIEPYKEYVDGNGNKILCYCYEFKEEDKKSLQYRVFNRLIYDEPWEKRILYNKG